MVLLRAAIWCAGLGLKPRDNQACRLWSAPAKILSRMVSRAVVWASAWQARARLATSVSGIFRTW